MRHTVRRSHLVRRVETWHVDAPDDVDLAHLLTDHFGLFDDDLTSGGSPLDGWSSAKAAEEDEIVEYDELAIEIVARSSADVIPIGRKRDRG